MQPISYLDPETVDEACELLDQYGSDAVILAGGQSLLQVMKQRLVGAEYVVDITNVEGLDAIEERDDSLRIGAAVPYVDVQQHPTVRDRVTALEEAISTIGDYQIRSRGTFVGGVAHADPQGDPPIVATALDATIHVASVEGERTIPASEFYRGFFETDLDAGELVTAVDVPIPNEATETTYQSFTQRMGDYAIAALTLVVERDGDVEQDGDVVTDARVIVGAMTDHPQRLSPVERSLDGRSITETTIEEAVTTARDAVDPFDDEVGSAAYKTQLVGELLREALESVQ